MLAEQFDHDLSTAEITGLLERLDRKPEGILTDNGGQFKDSWERWCKDNKITAHFAHPYYPQDKGKVERCIRNLNQEFIYHLRRFPGWLKGKIHEYREWYNRCRYHRGIEGMPAELYGV